MGGSFVYINVFRCMYDAYVFPEWCLHHTSHCLVTPAMLLSDYWRFTDLPSICLCAVFLILSFSC